MTDPVFVDLAWLQEHPEAVIIHVGTTMGGGDPRAAFDEMHLPGARFVSLDDDLADPPDGTRGRHPLPTGSRFAGVLRRLGVGLDDVVVGYDDRGGAFASRLVWMLRVLGADARVLEAPPLGDDSVSVGGSDQRSAGPADVDWPEGAVADADQVAAHISDGGVVIDAREPARYAGEVEPIDPVAGHVPGAINRFFGENLDGGRLRAISELRERFAVVAADPDAIVYCGSGVTACHDALTIEHAGFPRPRVYVGSWSGWTADPTRPIASRPRPTPPHPFS